MKVDEPINGSLPPMLKSLMVFIDRVGFPILAFLMMFWVAQQGLSKLSQALAENTKVQGEFAVSFHSFAGQVLGDHKVMCEDLRDIKRNIK
jgi:hypothetical protein